jgi:uncharacterized membrane protein YkvA (DUF1232 family)
MAKPTGEEVKQSNAYSKASTKAKIYVNDPEKLNELIRQAKEKADEEGKGPFDEIWEEFTMTIRLLNAYAKGQYRNVPLQTLLIFIAAIIYFVMPVDLVPDFLAGVGLLDDAALLGMVLKSFRADLHHFKLWEQHRALKE